MAGFCDSSLIFRIAEILGAKWLSSPRLNTDHISLASPVCLWLTDYQAPSHPHFLMLNFIGLLYSTDGQFFKTKKNNFHCGAVTQQ